MKTKINKLLVALSVAFLMVFSFNVFSQGNKPQQEDKEKKSGCMAMMQSKEEMSCMSMMDSQEMQAMCAKMMSGMKDGKMKMDGNKGNTTEPKSQKL